MSRLLRAGALLLALTPSAWAAKPLPPSPPSYIHNEGVIDPGTEERISRRLRRIEETTGHQFAVALFQSLDNENLERYSNALFKAWGIGSKKNNDGLLFCLFLNERRWRVEVGYGLESVITDLEAAEIARGQGVPYFKSGDFENGVSAVVEGLADKLAGTRHSPPKPDHENWLFTIWDILFPYIFFFVFFWIGLWRRFNNWSSRGYYSGGGGFGGGGFSGGGGSSGGGGASGGW